MENSMRVWRCGGFAVYAAASAVCACLLFASPLQAQNANEAASLNEETDDVFQLGAVTFRVEVQGEGLNVTEKMETSVTRSKIEMFEKKDVGTALARIPGIRYGGAPSGGRYESGVFVRGFTAYGNSGGGVPIFVDGIPVYVPYDYSMDMGRFTTSGVSTISVSKGYSSVLYGPNALGGVINVISQRPSKPLYGNIVFGMGSGGATDANGVFGTLQDKWYSQVGLSYLNREFVNMADTFTGSDATGQEKMTDRKNYGTRDKKMEFKFGYIPNATDEYVVSYLQQTAEKGPKRDASKCSEANPDCWAMGYMDTWWEWPYWDRETVSFVSNTDFKNFYLKPRVFYDKYDNGMYGWGRSYAQKGDYVSHYDDYAWGGSVEIGTLKIENNTLKGKFDYKFNQHKQYDVEGHDGGHIDGSDVRLEEQIFFFAIEDTHRFNEHWEVQGGLLYSRRQTTYVGDGLNINVLNTMFPGNNFDMKPSDIDSWDPEAALFYNLNKNHSFHYSIAKKTIFPSIRQQYSNLGSGSTYTTAPCSADDPCLLVTLPNPDLRPEKALHHEIGWSGRLYDRLNISLDWFYSKNNDAINRSDIDAVSFPGFAIQQVVNVEGDTRRQGFDLGAEYTATDRILVGTSFSYLHSINKDNPGWRSTQPAYNGSIYANIGLNNWAALIPALDYSGRSRAGSTGDNRWNFNQGYALVDLKLSITPPMHRNVNINIGAENLFDKDYRGWGTYNGTNLTQYPTPGRYLYANVRYRL